MSTNNIDQLRFSVNRRGAIAILTLLGVTVFALAVMTTLTTLITSESQMASADTASQQTFYTAEAGLNQALYSLAKDPSSGTAGSTTTSADGFTTTITITPDAGFPTTSPPGFQGYISVQTSDSTGKVRTLKVKATTSSLGSTFIYGAQTDTGGVKMSSSDSTINGEVYSNGSVTGSGTVNGNVTVADDSTLDQQDAVSDSEFPFGIHVGSTYYTDAAQGFTVGTTGTLNRFSVLLRRVGAAPPLLKWQITADNSGKPANSYLKFGTIDTADVGTSLSWVNINVPIPLAVTASTRYWVVLDTADSSGDHWVWGKDGADTYSGGSGYYTTSWTNSAAVWTPAEADGADLSFKTWLGTKYTSLGDVTVTGDVWADNISASEVCGNAYYFTITSTASSFLKAPTNPPCPTPLTPGTGTPADDLPKHKALPITTTDIQKWKNQIQVACTVASNCISGTYNVNSNTPTGASAALVNSGSLVVGTQYFYKVTAIDAAGAETGASGEVSKITTSSQRTIKVSWNSFTGATAYRVYRTTTSGTYTSSSLIATTTALFFTDDGSGAPQSGMPCLTTCLGWQKISGNLNVDKDLTLKGNVWVTGNITISNNMTIKIDSGLNSKSLVLLADGKIDVSNNVNLCGSDCAASNPTNFLLVVSNDSDTNNTCPPPPGTPTSIKAANNSASVIFVAPFGVLDVKKGTINAGASRDLCLETQATVNFTQVKDGIASLFISSPTQQPISAVANSWLEK